MAYDRTNLSCLISGLFSSRTAASKRCYGKIQSIQNFITKKQTLECRFDWRFVRRDSMNSKQTPITGSSSARCPSSVVIETLRTRKLIFWRKRSAGPTRRRTPDCSGLHGEFSQSSLATRHKLLWLMGRFGRLPEKISAQKLLKQMNLRDSTSITSNEPALICVRRSRTAEISLRKGIRGRKVLNDIGKRNNGTKNHLFRLITLHNPRVFVRISTSFFFSTLSGRYWKVQTCFQMNRRIVWS